MTLLIISTCSEKLSEREFVTPISKIVGEYEYKILHYTECTEENISEYSFQNTRKMIILNVKLS